MSEILYHDPQVTVYKELIVINKYYFPLATSKTIMFSDIERVALIDSDGVDHRWGICGKYLNNWFPLDTNRKNKKKFIEITLKGRKTRPSITPEDAEKVFRIIWENHTAEGKQYLETMSEKAGKRPKSRSKSLWIERRKKLWSKRNSTSPLKAKK